jgi:LuxR family maltose regulon positive regulatory protein
LLYCTGDIEGAFEALQKAQEKLTFQDSVIVFDDLFKTRNAYLYLLKGDLEEAAYLLEEVGVKVTKDVHFRQRNEYWTLAALLIARREYKNAIQVLTQLFDVCQNADAGLQVMRTRILKAKAQYLDGDLGRALESLKPAIDLAATESLYNYAFFVAGEPIAQLLYQAALDGIHAKFCNQLLAKFSTLVKLETGSHVDLVEPLSERELEVLQHIAQGWTNQEIAQELVLSLYTIKSHARNIFSKLGVKNRTEAVAKARLLGLLPRD